MNVTLDAATAHHRAGRLGKAEALYRQIVASEPTSAQAHNDLGNVLCDAGRCEEAIDAYRAALVLNPRYLPALNNLGTALRDLGRWAEAVDIYRAALAIDQRVPDVHNNLGVALADLGRLDDAIASYRRAIELSAAYADAYTNLGVTLYANGNSTGAVEACEKAVALRPDFAKAHSNLALILLGTGDFARGWVEHEWRWRCNPNFKPRAFGQARWEGDALAGRTILLHAEQGFGDTMQFVRFAPMVVERGGRVIVECRGELAGLLRESMDGVRVIARGETLPAFDLHCPLMSLPLALGVTLDSIPRSPYLKASPERVDRWVRAIGPRDRCRVGLVWAGRPTHTNDRNRSMRGADLAGLISTKGVAFHSLQCGRAAHELSGAEDHSGSLTDFAETAALIANLDLVISVDTAVTHLAGAMGKPVWLMLPYAAEWRWMLKRADSPWYPSARLFRQRRWGDWRGVVDEVTGALAGFVSRFEGVGSTIGA